MNRIALCLLGLACAVLASCKAASPIAKSGAEPIEYAEIASAYNERVNAIPSLWARGVVSISFINNKGDRQNEQGNCYLQVVRPSKISFIINKLEQQFVRLGCNGQMFWAMDMQEKTARVGDHTHSEAIIDQFGLPITPAELLTVFALSPLPTDESDVSVEWSEDQQHILISHPSAIGRTVHRVAPAIYLPVGADLYDGFGELVVRAEFSNPGRTPVPGQGAYSRQVPGQIDIHDLQNDSRIKVTFGTTDATRDIDPDNFNLDYLLEALGPFEIIEQ